MINTKNKLDVIFSLYIRHRDCINGIGRCCCCGKTIYINNCDSAHFISRSSMATRYDQKNVHACCKECNRFLNGNLYKYESFIINKYGQDELNRLKKLGKTTLKMSLSDKKELLKELKIKLKEYD